MLFLMAGSGLHLSLLMQMVHRGVCIDYLQPRLQAKMCFVCMPPFSAWDKVLQAKTERHLLSKFWQVHWVWMGNSMPQFVRLSFLTLLYGKVLLSSRWNIF